MCYICLPKVALVRNLGEVWKGLKTLGEDSSDGLSKGSWTCTFVGDLSYCNGVKGSHWNDSRCAI